ncbi:MAG: glycosyl transferase family 2 [Lutibacter sp.]|nr:MAG: glycosyl transferase family 2 [Lutibacter sp.]
MQLSVIIVNYNVQYFLELCLQSVQEALEEIDSEIIVVDNNSIDDSCKMVSEKFPKVICIRNNKNIGFAKANNQGVTKAKGQYVLILNPDTVVAKDTFKKILKFAKSRQNFGALGVKLIDGKGTFLPESKRGIPTPKVSFYKLIGFTSKSTGKYYANHLKENETGIVDILVGAFMFMRRKVYNEVKGFDERYFMYGEDIDLSYKILNKGYQNYYFADTQVIHYKGESTINDMKQLRYFHKAMEIFYDNHFKLNKIYDLIMRLGIKVWYLLKFFRLKRKEKEGISSEKLLYFGNEEETFNKIQSLKLDVKQYEFTGKKSLDNLEEFIKKNNIKELIFDNNNLTYQNIITEIVKLKKMDLTFKIHPKNTNYILGSNSSVTKGEVCIFK